MTIDKGTIFGAGLALLLASGAIAASASAQTGPAAAPAAAPKKGPAGNPADTDGDGRVSKVEAQAAERKAFAALDTNKDGRITLAERQGTADAARRANIDRQFAALDTDKNGSVSKAEFTAAVSKGVRPIESMGAMDANNDKAITQAEWDAFSVQAFDRMDANKDGFITPQERAAAVQAARAAAAAGAGKKK